MCHCHMAEDCNGANRDKVSTDLKILLQNSETKQFAIILHPFIKLIWWSKAIQSHDMKVHDMINTVHWPRLENQTLASL